MAAGVSSKTEIGIVLLGNDEVDKSKVIKSILGCRDLMEENVGQCVLYMKVNRLEEGFLGVVEAPGWNSMQQTPESIKKSIRRSVSLCPPGPHALLLVIPVKRDEEPSSGDIKAAEMHMELLSGRVWKHTIVLFACDDEVGEFDIKAYFQKAKKILEKCKGRTYILERRMAKVKSDFVNDPQALLMHYFKPISVIALAVFGALLGAVAGAEYGVYFWEAF